MQMWMTLVRAEFEITAPCAIPELLNWMGYYVAYGFGSNGASGLFDLSIEFTQAIAGNVNFINKMPLFQRLHYELEIIKRMYNEEEMEWCLPVPYPNKLSPYFFNELRNFEKWLSIYMVHDPSFDPETYSKWYYGKNLKFITKATWEALNLRNPHAPPPGRKTRTEAIIEFEQALKMPPLPTKPKKYRSIYED